ncbi:MAG: hypothetical protein M3336_12045 [Chloroflexota bacterium]|nr:hypothetical protein [Chloroflexota bacterium]
MLTYATDTITGAIQWLAGCKNLGEGSRASLVSVLSSPQFGAVLRQRDGSRILIEYEHDDTCACFPRRVLVEVLGRRPLVAITRDRGVWIFSYTGAAA